MESWQHNYNHQINSIEVYGIIVRNRITITKCVKKESDIIINLIIREGKYEKAI